ncbi:MAG: hypothetical protein IAG13_12290 [Deltaproteobacteria bacterium]|nr:hypothetical protein [Nannocystaceae bacterium]
MHSLACAAVPLAFALVVVAMPGDAAAAEGRRRIPYQAVDAQGMVVTQLFPRTHFGGDLAYVIGTETFQARFGGQVAGGRAFNLGPGKVGNTLAVFSLDACGAKKVFRHRVRMCMGGQGGMLAHHWHGYDRPGRKATPYVAGVLKGDYSYFIRESFALMFGVGVSIPVVGPTFRARNSNGALSSLVFPGPVTGVVTVGGSFRL